MVHTDEGGRKARRGGARQRYTTRRGKKKGQGAKRDLDLAPDPDKFIYLDSEDTLA